MKTLIWILAAATAAYAADSTIEEERLLQLLQVRRIYVDRLTGGETAAQMRDLLVSSLESAKFFVLTEKEARADAFLRGGAEDLVFTDVFSSSEGINARSNFGTGRSARTSRGDSVYGGIGVGENESSRTQERKHEAVAAVRLVNKEGDVIWSTTQESQGGKFHRASTDVADRITKKLAEDYERAKKLRPLPGGTATGSR
jgi:hypothetical protein